MNTKFSFEYLLILVCTGFGSCFGESLMSVSSSPFSVGDSPKGLSYSPRINGQYYLSVVNENSDNITVFKVDPVSGRLLEIVGSPFGTGSRPKGLSYSLNISGKYYLATANKKSNDVSVFEVNLSNGKLSEIVGSPFSAGDEPKSIAYSPEINGRYYLSVSNEKSHDIFVYQVDPADGKLTQIGNSPFSAGKKPTTIEYSPEINGAYYLASANEDSDNISIYRINSKNGELLEISGSPFIAGPKSRGLSYSSNIKGRYYLSVVNKDSDSVSVFEINQLTGQPVEINNSPFKVGAKPKNVAYSSCINCEYFLAVTNEDSNNVSVFKVNSNTGDLMEISSSPLAVGLSPQSVSFSSDINGVHYLAVSNEKSNNVSAFVFQDKDDCRSPISKAIVNKYCNS